MTDHADVDALQFLQQRLGARLAQVRQQHDRFGLLADPRHQFAQRRQRIGNGELTFAAGQGQDLLLGIQHADDAVLHPVALDDLVRRQDQFAGLRVAHVGIDERQTVLRHHFTQEVEPVVQVLLAQTDRVQPERAEHLAKETRLLALVLVARSEDVARIHVQQRLVLLPHLVHKGSPPGQPTTLVSLSATGLDLAFDIAEVEQGDVFPVTMLGGGRSGRRPGSGRQRTRGDQQQADPQK